MSLGRGSHIGPLQIGGGFAVASAVLFGVSTPFVQRFGEHVGPYETAGLLYVGAALASIRGMRRGDAEAPIRRAHMGRLFAVALCGALIAPVCLAWGLHRTSATIASLLLASEAVFTVAFSHVLYREAVGRRVAFAVACIGLGTGLLVRDAGAVPGMAGVGAVAILVASLAWAADNALSRPLADLDLRQVVLVKSTAGSAFALLLTLMMHEPAPTLVAALGLVITGGLGYGTSLRLYLHAQRRIGAARTASIFASAPFLGAIAAWTIGDRTAGWTTLAAGGSIALGIYLHLSERHGHGHAHVAMDHEHAHRHDDGHHLHVHEPPFTGEHSHPHRHAPDWHAHPHGPDIHHRHDHD